MRRTGFSRRYSTTASEETHYWPAFADLMAGFALALVLLMLISWVHAMVKARIIDTAFEATASSVNVRGEILDVLGLGQNGTGPLTEPASGYRAGLARDGSIVIKEGVLFDPNEWQIKPEGRPVLDRLGEAFLTLLDRDDLREYIDAILVEGHTDSTGKREWNWLLSSRRAIAVVQYLYESVPRLASDYPHYLAAVGYSKYRPANDTADIEKANRTEALRRENRRIEFRLHLKDEKITERVLQTLGTRGKTDREP